MREYLLVIVASAAITYLFTPPVRTLAIRYNFMAKVRDRDVHDKPIPRLGGLAMYFGVFAGLAISLQLPLMSSVFEDSSQIRALIIGVTVVVLIGLVDDRWSLDGPTKLAGQTFAAALMALQGITLIWLPIPFTDVTLSLDPTTGVLVTVLIILITLNAVNFVDGLDGLAAGVVALGGTAFFVYSYLLSVTYGFTRATLPTLISAILVGICLGFLPHNLHPARIFMGDTGSMLIGLLLAACAITLTGQTDAAALETSTVLPPILILLLPLAVIAVPLLDLILALFRRTRRKTNVFTPDKEHLHHRLLERGHSHRRAVALMHLGTALLAFSAVSTAFISPIYTIAILIVGLLLLFFFGRRQTKKTEKVK